MKYLTPDWPAPACIHAYTLLRHYQLHPHDVSSHLKTLLSLPEELCWIKQTHSAVAIEATPENKEPCADASFTMQPNRACIVLTADCLPLLVCNQQGTHIAAIHAGWRGLAKGVIESTLDALQQPTSHLLVWLGPAISSQRYEVGEDVYEAFVSQHAESKTAFVPHTQGKWLADLYELARIRLRLQGVLQIYGGSFCTYTQTDHFFSYRRDKQHTGRMASLIWISDNS